MLSLRSASRLRARWKALSKGAEGNVEYLVKAVYQA